jgi:hypothetical protein
MRQCILWYVLLLLFYSWVMPDTRMYESISSIFFVPACDTMCSLKYWITVKRSIVETIGAKMQNYSE